MIKTIVANEHMEGFPNKLIKLKLCTDLIMAGDFWNSVRLLSDYSDNGVNVARCMQVNIT